MAGPRSFARPGDAASSVSTVGSAAQAARSIAARVAGGSRATRRAMSVPSVSGTGSGSCDICRRAGSDQGPGELQRVQRIAP